MGDLGLKISTREDNHGRIGRLKISDPQSRSAAELFRDRIIHKLEKKLRSSRLQLQRF